MVHKWEENMKKNILKQGYHSCHQGSCSNCQWYYSSCYIPTDKILNLQFLNRFVIPLCNWASCSNCQRYYSRCYLPPEEILNLKFLNRLIMPLCHWAAFSNCQWYYSSCYIRPEEILNLKFLNRVIILVIKVHLVTVDGISPSFIYHPTKS